MINLVHEAQKSDGILCHLARAGYASRGFVYLVIGVLALSYALTGNGDVVGSKGALQDLLSAPFGRVILAALALGLAAYSLWRVAQALANADSHKPDAKGYGIRGALFTSGAAHVFLAIFAGQLALGMSGGGSEGEGQRTVISFLLSLSFGNVLVIALGACVIIAGAAQIWKALSGSYKKRLSLPASGSNVLSGLSMIGLVMRGLLFALLGAFVVYAGYTYDPSQAASVQGGLQWLRTQNYGEALFIMMAAGLVAFAGYSFIEARWRKFG